jgi:protein involved in polysaccharide export with SLBB domain
MEAISMANGFTDFAQTESITIRRDNEIKSVNVQSFLENREKAGHDFMLQAGDTIYVNKLEHEKKVFVLGEVNMPGAYELTRTITLLEALALAGSYKSTSNLDDVVVERRSSTKKLVYHVNLSRVLDEGDLAQNINILPGDSIYVPRGSMRKIMVLGEVTSPGVYEFNRGMTVLEGISTAGSYTGRAVLKKAAVIRGAGPQREIIKINLEQIIHEGRLSENIQLAAGDVIYIPETLEPDWAKNILPMLESIQIGRDLVKNW